MWVSRFSQEADKRCSLLQYLGALMIWSQLIPVRHVTTTHSSRVVIAENLHLKGHGFEFHNLNELWMQDNLTSNSELS